MRRIISICIGSFVCITTAYATSNRYSISGECPLPELEGKTAFLFNELNEKIDSTVIKNGRLLLTGNVDTPHWAHIEINGEELGSFVVEPGEIILSESDYTRGGKFNNILANLNSVCDSLRRMTFFEENEVIREQLRNKHRNFVDSVFVSNVDNPVGLYLFRNRVMLYEPEELFAEVEKYPQMKEDPSVKELIQLANNKLKTMPGNKFVDFTVTTDSCSQSLSDFAGQGKPVLVDFWASWCGPCILETGSIRELYDEYGEKGLEVVGVAVWDKPNDTIGALDQHKFPWPQLINAQRIPSDLYGFSKIPFNLLIAPDGTIVGRDLHGDELIQSVKSLMDSLETN